VKNPSARWPCSSLLEPLDCREKAYLKFNGTIEQMRVKYV